MNKKKIVSLVISSVFANASLCVSASEIEKAWEISSVHQKNKEAAEFGLMVASKSLSYVTKVVKGKTDNSQLVTVNVAGKTCVVDVRIENDKLMAHNFDCQK